MGKILTFIVGVFVLAASHLVRNVQEYIPWMFAYAEEMPVNWEVIFNLVGNGFLILGLGLTGYAGITAVWSIIQDVRQPDEEAEDEEGQGQRQGPQGPQQGGQQNWAQGQGRQQQQQQYRQNPPGGGRQRQPYPEQDGQ